MIGMPTADSLGQNWKIGLFCVSAAISGQFIFNSQRTNITSLSLEISNAGMRQQFAVCGNQISISESINDLHSDCCSENCLWPPMNCEILATNMSCFSTIIIVAIDLLSSLLSPLSSLPLLSPFSFLLSPFPLSFLLSPISSLPYLLSPLSRTLSPISRTETGFLSPRRGER